MNHAIGLGAEQDNGKRQGRSFILFRQAFVHRQKKVELAGVRDFAQEFSVADARPAGLRHGLDLVAGEFARQVFGQTFVQQDAHSGGGEQAFAGFFEKADGLGA